MVLSCSQETKNILKRHVTHRRDEIHCVVNFFGDTRTFHVGLKTENFQPGMKWTF